MSQNKRTIEKKHPKYETVIGLEVHLQLSTNTKIFCGCANSFGDDPNTNTCPVCLGFPGSLPVVNQKALEYAIKIGLALNCEINTFVKFDRKQYFYPDCPKAYQITQLEFPTTTNGFLEIPDSYSEGTKKIRINRGHLEEDAGKLIHDDANNCSLVDYNRTGTPLIEIVTEPDIRSAQEAYDYLQNLKLTLQYLNVSDCDMEKGSLRCDANVSVRPHGEEKLGKKTELKNMNSFKAVKTAIEYEINRHRQLHDAGQEIVQETLLWDENKQCSVSMRSKEDAHDYRYFPEPDLVPFVIDDAVVKNIAASLPELPAGKRERFIKDYDISFYDAQIIIQDPHTADFFEECAEHYKNTKKICNWLNGAVLQELNARKISIKDMKCSPKNLASLIQKVDDDVVSNLVAKDVFRFMLEEGQTADAIIEEKGLAQMSDDGAMDELVDQLISSNEKIVAQIKDGKMNAIGALVGQAMKQTQGKANPKKINEILKRRILND